MSLLFALFFLLKQDKIQSSEVELQAICFWKMTFLTAVSVSWALDFWMLSVSDSKNIWQQHYFQICWHPVAFVVDIVTFRVVIDP